MTRIATVCNYYNLKPLTLVIGRRGVSLIYMKKLLMNSVILASLSFPLWGSASSYELINEKDELQFWSLVSGTKKTLKKEITQEVVSHYQEVILPALSREIQKKMAAFQILFVIENNESTEGTFYPPTKHRYFKEKNQLVISLSKSILGSPGYLRLVTHELFHAIHFVINPGEKSWVQEGLAQLFEYKIHGSYNDKNILMALSDSTTPLMGEYDLNHPDAEQYGHNFLYFYYLDSKCESEKGDLFWKLASAKKKSVKNLFGESGIDDVLTHHISKRKICSSFKASAEAFTLARVINRYSGKTQSDETFILDHLVHMDEQKVFETNFEGLSYKDKKEFLNSLPAYLPLYIEGAWAQKALGMMTADELSQLGLKIYALTPYFPYNSLELRPSELKSSDLTHQNLILFKAQK